MRVEIQADGRKAPYAAGEMLDSGTATTERGVLRIANRAARRHQTGVRVYIDGTRQVIGCEGYTVVAVVCGVDQTPDEERTGCTCEKCVAACANRPCWGTPEDIGKLLDLGLADRLMLDWWVGGFDDDSYGDTYIIAPACRGHEGDRAPEMGLFNFGSSFGRCVFLDDDDRCEIHKLKPSEGRKAYLCQADIDHGKLHEDTARTWDTEEGRLVVLRWKQAVGY